MTGIETDGTPADQVLRVAAGLERSSEHPLARAVMAAARERGDLARETADILLPEGGLRLLPWLIGLSWGVRRTILANLLWAFGYNSIGLGLAVSGHLQPVLAAVLMAGSSLLVVLNSRRLERFVEPSDNPRPADAPASERRSLQQHTRPQASAPRPAA